MVVGPTNIVQESKEDNNCSIESLTMMENHFYNSFPGLKGLKIVATYAGLRPNSPQSKDYIIRFNEEKNFATLGAIRSTGLTGSRAIAQYCAQNIFPDYDKIPRKADIVMPEPKSCPDGTNDEVGLWKFKPCHKLSELGFSSKSKQKSPLSSL